MNQENLKKNTQEYQKPRKLPLDSPMFEGPLLVQFFGQACQTWTKEN
jgi:hypothetical protein